MQNAIVKTFTCEAANASFNVFNYKGQPITLAIELERATGITEGRLSDMLRDDRKRAADKGWPLQYRPGVDYAVIEGDELADLKSALNQLSVSDTLSSTQQSVSHTLSSLIGRRAKSLLVFYQSGVDMVLLASNTKAGIILRHFLADEVFPVLRKGGFKMLQRKERMDRAASKRRIREKNADARMLKNADRVIGRFPKGHRRDDVATRMLARIGLYTRDEVHKMLEEDAAAREREEEKRQLQHPVARWIEERCDEVPVEGGSPPGELYEDYAVWRAADLGGSKGVERSVHFSMMLTELGHPRAAKQVTLGGKRVRLRPLRIRDYVRKASMH